MKVIVSCCCPSQTLMGTQGRMTHLSYLPLRFL